MAVLQVFSDKILQCRFCSIFTVNLSSDDITRNLLGFCN